MIPDPNNPAFVGALIYFDQAAQRLSFAAAAEVLGVTPSAVSHRISALEAALGKRLFERETRRVRLTPDGAELANVTKQTLDQLRSVVSSLTQRPVLRVSVGPYLSSTWLMPRIRDFEQKTPGLRIDLVHVIGSVNPRDVDVSILWEDTEPRTADHTNLFDTSSVPVVAPEGLTDVPFWETSLLPIHYRGRQPWRHWLHASGAPVDYAERGEVLHDPNLVLEAAAHGRGVAIGFLPFVAEMFARGRLVAASKTIVPAERAYRVAVWSHSNPITLGFRDWLMQQAHTNTALNEL